SLAISFSMEMDRSIIVLPIIGASLVLNAPAQPKHRVQSRRGFMPKRLLACAESERLLQSSRALLIRCAPELASNVTCFMFNPLLSSPDAAASDLHPSG